MAATALLRRILLPPLPLKTPYHHHHPPPPSFSAPSPAAPPSSYQPPLIPTVISLLTHHPSKSRWTRLRSLLSAATAGVTSTEFSQITLHLKSKPHLAHRFFNFTVENSLCIHDLRSFSSLIHILTRARLINRAESVIRIALGSAGTEPMGLFRVLLETYRECDSAPFVFDLLVKCCLELKKLDGSLEIVRLLRSKGISPQIITCNSLIEAVSRCKGSFSGYGIFREVFGLEGSEGDVAKKVVGIKPNVQSFNALMVGFLRDGELEMVEEIWREMGRLGCVGDRYSYSVLMAAFCDGGKVGEAENSWEEMMVKGIKPDVLAYNTIIGGFCKIGEVEKAEGFFREMGLNGIEGSCVTFEHLINGYCGIGDVDSAMLVYKDMRRKDFNPRASTIDVLVGGLCEKKRVSEALRIMKMATKDFSFCPSEKSYELLIRGLCEDGAMEEAMKVQAEMVGKGFEPNSKIYEAFIDGYMKLGNDEMAAALRKEMSEVLEPQQED